MTNPAATDFGTEFRYPIGRFTVPKAPLSNEQREACIAGIEGCPALLRDAVRGLSREQLDTPYRPEGWTVRQLIHHVPDSHMNAYVRFKLALTEDAPAIKTYDEARWAELPDTQLTPPEVSLSLLEVLHVRWVTLLRAMKPADFERSFRHPEWGNISLDRTLALYQWHGAHHTAHVTRLRERMGW